MAGCLELKFLGGSTSFSSRPHEVRIKSMDYMTVKSIPRAVELHLRPSKARALHRTSFSCQELKTLSGFSCSHAGSSRHMDYSALKHNRLASFHIPRHQRPLRKEKLRIKAEAGDVAQLTAETLFSKLAGADSLHFAGEDKITKITVVGVGNVGMACAQTILTENLTDEIALVDVAPDKLRGEMLDLQHAAAFLPNVKIVADTNYAVTAGSDLCIITAGARQREGEDRLSLVDRNVSIFRNIIPQLVKYSPDTILLVISNPVDILSWVTWKLSGLHPNRVIGSGTNLDSSRFRFLIARLFGVSAQNVHAHILGEHGDSSVPLWSSVSVGGVPIPAFLGRRGIPTNLEELKRTHKAVVDGAYEVIRLKGYTSWAIGYSVASLCKSLLRNQRRVHPVSVLAKGFHGIEEEVYLSLPASLGRAGVVGVANSVLSVEEDLQLQQSAKALYDVQHKLGL